MVYAGLCAACRNARTVRSRRGSAFTLCALSATDPRFPRYPGLPVLRCAGFASALDTGDARHDPVTPDDPAAAEGGLGD
jgi:hypothetical protein